MRSSSGDDTFFAQVTDCVGVVSEFVQDLSRMFAEKWSALVDHFRSCVHSPCRSGAANRTDHIVAVLGHRVSGYSLGVQVQLVSRDNRPNWNIVSSECIEGFLICPPRHSLSNDFLEFVKIFTV